MNELFALTDEDYIRGLKAREAKVTSDIAEKEKEIIGMRENLKVIKTAIEGFKGLVKSQTPEKEIKKISIPAQYSNELTWSKKILFIVNFLNGALVSDITDELIKREPEKDVLATKRIVTMYASHLKRYGNLRFEVLGNKYRYMI